MIGRSPRSTPNSGSGIQLESGSCTTGDLCIVGDVDGNVFTSTDVGSTSGTWVGDNVTSATVSALSCGATNLCAGGDAAGNLFATTDPTDNPPTWSTATGLVLTHPINTIDCSYHHLLHRR